MIHVVKWWDGALLAPLKELSKCNGSNFYSPTKPARKVGER